MAKKKTRKIDKLYAGQNGQTLDRHFGEKYYDLTLTIFAFLFIYLFIGTK